MCGRCEESISNLFFNYLITVSIWKWCDNWVGIATVHHNVAKYHFHQFCLPRLSKKK